MKFIFLLSLGLIMTCCTFQQSFDEFPNLLTQLQDQQMKIYFEDADKELIISDHQIYLDLFNGVYDGLRIFANVTNRQECLALAPIIDRNIIIIENVLRNATTTVEYFDALRDIITILQHTYNDIELRKDYCDNFIEGVNQVIRKTRQFVIKLKSMSRFYTHLISNIPAFIWKYESLKGFYLNKNWYETGYMIGDIVNFLFLWELDNPHT